MHVGTGKAAEADATLTGLARGRHDHQFFSWHFLNRKLHDGQLEYVQNSEATINVLATANRWGKTTELLHIHAHADIYKTGAEPRYLDVSGAIDQEKFLQLRYNTVHAADLWETAALVWDDANKTISESPNFRAFIKDNPKSHPVKIDYIHGSRWKFRTLGHDASNIDGNSFYVITLDEAGWVSELESKMNNVIRVRVADVGGRIHLVGTFKPGISRDFYKYAVRASAYTGRGLTLDHRTDEEEESVTERDEEKVNLDASIRKYLREFFKREADRGNSFSDELVTNLAQLGITPDEFVDAAGGGR